MIWVSVFQLVPVTLATYPINYIILHVTCPLDSSREVASIILASVQFVSTSIAWFAVYFYYRRNESQLKPHRGWRKLNSFQSLVALQAMQALIFPVVTQTNAYHPTAYVNVEDFTNSIPAFMTCWECLIWSILFLKVFTFTPYRNAVLQERAARPAKVERAAMDTLNQMDLIRGTIYMFQILFCMADRKDSKDMEKLSKEQSTVYAPVDSARTRQGWYLLDRAASDTHHHNPFCNNKSRNFGELWDTMEIVKDERTIPLELSRPFGQRKNSEWPLEMESNNSYGR